MSFPILQLIAPKGLAAFGSIDILHKKCDSPPLALSIAKWGNLKEFGVDAEALLCYSRLAMEVGLFFMPKIRN